MVETLSVSVSGPAFSLLLYENVRRDFDQEGFLLGEIVERESNNITDNDEQITKIDRIIRINSAVPLPKLNYIYDGVGAIDKNKIVKFLGEDMLKVVAWYKFKRTNAFKLTLREKIVFKQLAEYFGTTPELFSCCLLTANSSPNGSTHIYSQTFLRYYEQMYQSLPMHIINLSDPKSTYKTPEPSSKTFNDIVKSLNIEKKRLHGVHIATNIHCALQKHIEGVVAQLTDSEKRLFELEREIRTLEERAESKRLRPAEDVTQDAENGEVEMSSGESSPELGRRNLCRKSSLRTKSKTPVKTEISSENIMDNRTRSSKKSYSQAAQKSKN